MESKPQVKAEERIAETIGDKLKTIKNTDMHN